MRYEMEGLFIEACDCFSLCPCWLNGAPDEDKCTGLIAWHIKTGSIGDVDVSGRLVASVSSHTGHRSAGRQRVSLFVDSAASDRQLDVLGAVFSGRAGGPLAELGHLLDEMDDIQRSTIALDDDNGHIVLAVGSAVHTEAVQFIGPNGSPTTLHDGALADALANPVTVGESSRLLIELPDRGVQLDVQRRSTTTGHFRYRHLGEETNSNQRGGHRT